MKRRSHTLWLVPLVSLLASLTMLAAAQGCGSGGSDPAPSSASGIADKPTATPRDSSLVFNASPPPMNPAATPADLPLLGLDGAPVPVVDDALAEYQMLRLVVVMNLDGEVFPCGCSDGQVGGLVTLLPKLDALQPALVAGLGDNYLPRSIPPATVESSANYFRARMAFVQALLAENRRVVETLSPAEAALAGIGVASPVVQRINFAGHAVDLVLGRAERWPGADPVGKSDPGVLRLLLLCGEHLNAGASFNGLDRALWFRSPMSSGGLPPNVSLIARPSSGGRGAVVLSLLFPAGPHAVGPLTMLDEIRTLRTAIAKTATQGEPAAEFRGRLEKRAALLLASRPIFVGIQQVAVTTDDPVEPRLYARYAAFLARHGAASSRQLVAVAGNAANAKCATCHADYVSRFESQDPHFKAMQTLRHAGKGEDPFCMSCHITPLAVDASRSIGEPQAMEGVQCQWCHQSAEQHASSPYAIKPKAVTSNVCIVCHNENQSPKYAWDRYVPRLSCHAVKRKGESRD